MYLNNASTSKQKRKKYFTINENLRFLTIYSRRFIKYLFLFYVQHQRKISIANGEL